MKKLLLVFTLLFASVLAHAQGCDANPWFRTQAEIDRFSVTYRGCTNINGSVTVIGRSDITNLNGLSSIKSISEGIFISDNPRLTSISALSGITNLGSIYIDRNPLLENLTGLDNILTTSVIYINGNANLTSIQALKNISIISSGINNTNNVLYIVENPLLTNLSGLENITFTGNVTISGNRSLTNLDGLKNLANIVGDLIIMDNPALLDLKGLMKLTSLGTVNNLSNIREFLNIGNNDALTSLSGLDNVDLSMVEVINIANSHSLSFCGVKSICQILGEDKIFLFNDNAAGCLSKSEVMSSGSCQEILPVTLVSFTGKNTIEGNRLSWQTTSETNNSGFSVERSINGKFFEETGFVKGNGNVDNQTKDYSFIDKAPGEITYYRLKQIDFDQTFTYSKIIVVKSGDLANIQKGNTIVYPNPARGQLMIETKNRDQEYRIQSMQGVTLREESVLPSKPIDTSFLQDGLYMITVGKEVFKVVVNN